MYITPMALAVSGSQIVVPFDYDDAASYHWCVSTTDAEGKASERRYYCLAYEQEKLGKKSWAIVLAKVI